MDQEPIKTYSPPPQDKKPGNGRNVLTIIILILAPIIGVIVMWFIATWSQKVKIIITAILASIFLAAVILVSLPGNEQARDAQRKYNMQGIYTVQSWYSYKYGDYDNYYTCNGLGADCGTLSWPENIEAKGDIIMQGVPTDPLEDTETPYVWIDNTLDTKKFCAYAVLEKGGYYTASHEGTFECSDAVPTLDDCCF